MALVKKRKDTELALPPPVAKKIKRPRKILEEDVYTETLSKIIARDYYPGLAESEITQEYLNALESHDEDWILDVSQRLRQVLKSADHQSGSTHTTETSSISGGTKPALDISNMSLGKFQATYTSEDNESFYKVVDRQNQKKVDKYSWLWQGNRLPSRRELKQIEVEAKLGAQHALIAPKPGDKNRPAMPDTWTCAPRNHLMFIPEGVEPSGEKVAGTQPDAPVNARPPRVIHSNTRLRSEQTVASRLAGAGTPQRAPPSPSLSDIRAAIHGKLPPKYQDSEVGASETPHVNGWTFVEDEEPVAQDRPKKYSHKIDLGFGDATPNPFNLQESSKREKLHKKILERIAESKRTSVRLGMTGKDTRMTTTPRYPGSPSLAGSLTPAAQRLLSNIRPGSMTPRRSLADNKRKFPRS